MRPYLSILAVAVTMATAPAFAQQAGKLASQDREFAERAMASNMLEVELGKMADQRASNADVKSFGQRMVTDHSKANQQLISVAQSHGLKEPTTLPRDERKQVDKLSGLQGEQFDSAYMSSMVKDHQKDITDYRKEISDGKNADLKSYAQNTLPILEQHLSQAQSLAPQGASLPQSQQQR